MSPTKRAIYVGLALLTAIVLAYSHVWHCDFIDYDDNTHVFRNDHVASGLSVGNVVWAFTHFHAAQWIPLTWISFMVDVSLFGLDPGPLHLVNVALHCFNAMLLFGLLWRMTGAYWRSACVAALFAVHPINVETVAWITERKSLLNTMLWFLAVGCHVRYVAHRKARWLTLTVVCMALGIMSKAMIVTLPFTLLLLDVWPLRRVPGTTWWRLFLEKLPLFALTIVACVVQIRAGMAEKLLWSTEAAPVMVRLGTAAANVLHYIGAFVYPSRLAVQYPLAYEASAWLAIGSAAMIGAFLYAAWRLRERAPYLLPGSLWFLGTLTPVSGIVRAGDVVFADRFTYVPQIGFFVVVVWAGHSLLRRSRPYFAPTFALGTLLLLIGSTIRYTATWTDTESLFTAAAEKWPTSLKAQMNAGYAIARKGDAQRALPHYEAALNLGPDLAETRSNYGVALGKLGRTDDAIAQFRRASADDPTLIMARFNLATHLLRKEGGASEAAALLRQIQIDAPTLSVADFWLGQALEAEGDLAAAKTAYRSRLLENPSDTSAAERLRILEAI